MENGKKETRKEVSQKESATGSTEETEGEEEGSAMYVCVCVCVCAKRQETREKKHARPAK